jgi:23S rRNA (adenine2503-C2)-methyltransferase
MGMGEPLLNYKNVLSAISILTDPNRYGISPKRITLSTAGISKMIRKLGDDRVRFNLALSLHAADDVKRSDVMEINQSNNLESLSDALTYFHEKTETRVTFEYILFRDFNDSLEDASKLAAFARCIPCKINLIEYNPIGDGKFKRSEAQKTEAFKTFLEEKNLIVNVRRSRGKDIDAACGQLANKTR